MGSQFLITFGSLWQAFVPARTAYLPTRFKDLLLPTTHPSSLAVACTLVICLLLVGALRGVRARCFFLCCVLIETLAFAATVREPRMRHLGFIFSSLLIALMIDAHDDASVTERPWRAFRVCRIGMYFSLVLVMFAGLWSYVSDLRRPFSEGKEAAQWLRQSGFDAFPLVIARDSVGATLLAYLPNHKAYYPECNCIESFILYNKGRTGEEMVTGEELRQLSGDAHSPVLLALTFRPAEETIDELGLQKIKAFNHHPLDSEQSFYIYLWLGPQVR